MIYDVLIIGGGAAGLGAALYSARFSMKTILIAKEVGGTGNIAHQVDNWIGEPGISGMALMKKFIDHVKQYNVPMVDDEVIEIKKSGKGFKVKTTSGESYESKTLIYSAGMKYGKLNIPGEKEFEGKGVHYCYTCDGPLYKNKVVGVVGGSDAAGLASLMLKDYAKKVYVIYRKGKLRAEPITSENVYKEKKIEVIHNSNVVEIKGDKFINSVKLDTGKEIKLDGLFIQIGHIPLTDIAKKLGVNLVKGIIKVDKTQSTNINGFFAAGDLTDASKLKQFITSAAEGSVAAQSAYNYVAKQ
jgi:thioredoxin reductase (NADPH)